jgi:hypothetical protein
MRTGVATTALLVALTVTVAAQSSSATTKGNIIGTWVKHHTKVEDHGYPGDADWQLEVTFAADGTFAWRSARTALKTEAGESTDSSAKGKYVTEGHLITYHFDDLPESILKEIPQFFAFWPRQLRGQQTVSFRDGFLRLGNDGGKTWIFLSRKVTQAVEPPAGADPAQGGPAQP